MLWNLLAECRHQTQIGAPFVQNQFAKLRRFHPASENRQLLRSGKSSDEHLVIRSVWIFPKPHFGICKWLIGVVRRDANHFNASCQFAKEQFAEDVITTHEAAE